MGISWHPRQAGSSGTGQEQEERVQGVDWGFSKTGHRNRLPGEVVAPRLSAFRRHLNNALNKMLQLFCSPDLVK